MEQILLGYTLDSAHALGQAVGIPVGEDALDPDVLRESVQLVHTEKHGTIGDFGAHALYLHERRTGVVGGELRCLGKVEAVLQARHGVHDVLSPEPRPQETQRLGSLTDQLFRRRVAAVVLAEAANYPLDAGNVVVLRNNERAERFPAVLPQYAYTARESAGFGQRLVLGEPALELAVVAAEANC